MPHNGHVLTRVIKDVFPRYKTMRGYDVPRKAGWDTHGLPVEVEVEKELRIHGKAEIERYGVEPFTERCIESVFRYTEEWETLTERDRLLGRPRRRLRHLPPQLRRERLVGALRAVQARACSTAATRSSGGGRRAAPRSRGRGRPGLQDRRRPQRLRRLPAARRARHRAPRLDDDAVDAARRTCTPRCKPDVRLRHRGRRRAQAHRRRGAARGARARSSSRSCPSLATPQGQRARRPALHAALRRVCPARGRHGAAARERRHGRARLARDRRGLRHARQRHRHRPHRARLRRGRLRGLPPRAHALRQPEAARRCSARCSPTAPSSERRAPARRPLREGRRQGPPARAQGARAARARRAVPPRVPVLLARRRRPADPVRAARLVHPHDRPSRTRRIANNRAVHWLPEHIKEGRFGDFLAQQRRLGALARALLGHAAQRLGERRDGRDGGRRLAPALREIRGATRRAFEPSFEPPRQQADPTPAPSTSSSTSRGSTRSPSTKPGEPGALSRACPR